MDITKMLVRDLLRLFLAIAIIVLIIWGGLKIYNTYIEAEDPVNGGVVADDSENGGDNSSDENGSDADDETETPSDKDEAVLGVRVVKTKLASGQMQDESAKDGGPKIVKKTGTILAGQEIGVSPEVAAEVEEVFVGEGSLVKKGQVLVKLGNSTQLETALVSYDAALKSLDNAKKLLDLTVRGGEIGMSSFEEQFASAYLNLQKANMQLEMSQITRYTQMDIERLNQQALENVGEQVKWGLSKAGVDIDAMSDSFGGSTSGRQNEPDFYGDYLKDSFKANRDIVDAKTQNMGNMQMMWQDVGDVMGIQAAQIQLGALEKQMAATDVQNQTAVVNLQSQIAQVEQQLKTAEISLKAGEIRSPIDGVITDVQIVKGAKVAPGVQILTVVNFDSLNVKMFVAPSEVFMLANEVENIFIEVLGEKVPAKIKFIGLVANQQTKTIPLELEPVLKDTKTQQKFIPNTFGKVLFEMKEQAGGTGGGSLWVSSGSGTEVSVMALRKESDRLQVAVENDGVVKFKDVVLAPGVKGGKVQILSGILDGENVVVDPSPFDLREGMKVKVIQ